VGLEIRVSGCRRRRGRIRSVDGVRRPGERSGSVDPRLVPATKEPAVFGFILLPVLLLSQPAVEECPSSDISPAAFSRWFEEARQGRLAIPAELARNATHYRYVLINGLAIGVTQGNFAQNVKGLQERGVPRASIHLINPSASKTVSEYAETLRAEMRQLASRGPEPLVVMAHSRGACDALAFALMNPEFIDRRVRALFLVQGPFGGSAAADYAAGEGPPIDRQMPIRELIPIPHTPTPWIQ